MKRKFLLIALAVISLSACKKNADFQITPESLCYDIKKIQLDFEYSALKEFYDPQPFEQLKEDVLSGKADQLECIYRIKEILSSYHVSHLSLTPTFDNETYFSTFFPFLLHHYEDGFHVIVATKKYEKFLGAKVVEINDIQMDEVVERLAKYLSYETPTQKISLIQTYFSTYTLEHAGLVQKNGKIKVRFLMEDGTYKTITCKGTKFPKKNTSDKFVQLRQNSQDPCLTLQDRYDYYTFKTSQENKTFYIHINQINGNPNYRLDSFFSDIINELNSNEYETVVIDLRNNPGGQSIYANLFISMFSKYREEFGKYNMAVVTTGNTASAACWLLNSLLMFFPNTVIFGEETGQAISNYTLVNLSNVMWSLQCDFMFPETLDTYNEFLIKRAKEVTHSSIHCGTLPDIEVCETFEGYMNGKDAIYQAIAEYDFN